jgi:type IV secretory pathway TrbF-like protein
MRRLGARVALRLPRLIAAYLGRPASEAAGPAANPFVAARHEFMNAFGDLAKGKRNWQVIAYALMGLLGLVTLAYVRLVQSRRVVPYVVQVDRLGQVVTVGPADELKRPDQRLIASELAQFVRAIRTVLPAAAAAGEAEMLRRGYAFVGPAAAAFLNDYFANPVNDPRVLGLRLTRQVDVTGVLRVPDSDVWRLQWTETERSTEPGGTTRTLAWEGYVTVTLVPPATTAALEDNPLGLVVTSVNWTQVGESWSTGPAGPAGPPGPTGLRGIDPTTPGADTTLH